jgi:hypothetical protein
MLTARISIALGGSLLILILLLVIAVSTAFFFYRYTLPPLPARLRIILSLLRALSLSLIFLILFEPIFRLISSSNQSPVLAVLIDDSQSMTIKDGNGDRAKIVKQFLQKKQFRNVPSDVRVQYYKVASKLGSSEGGIPDSLSFKGETTDLSAVLSEVKEQIQRENIQTLVLITDGEYTTGKNPIYAAEALGIPVYTVGVGDTSDQKDILVEKIATNNIAYAETRVPVDVTIKSSGYKNENVEVLLTEGVGTVDRKVVQLQEGTREYPLRLFIEPKDDGTRKFTVNVSHLPGELTEKNNTRSFFVKVLRSKLQVLLIAGSPSPDVSAVRQALVEDEHFSVRSLVQKDETGFYVGGFTNTAADSADCFVFVGYPTAAADGGTIQKLLEIIEREKKPILFVNSKTISYDRLRMFESILPFTWSDVNTDEILVFPSIVEKHNLHPLITLEGNMTAENWQKLPPIYKTQTFFKMKPESDMLAAVRLQNVDLAEPLILIRSINRQKTFAITGHGIWRWRLLAQNNSQTDKFFSLLISNAVRWLTTKEDVKNVRIVPAKETFTTAEPVEFTAQVYDEQIKPVGDAEVVVDLMRGKEKFPLVFHAVGDGLYEGSIDGVGEGDYTFTGKASSGGKIFGEDKGRISVGQMNAEFIDTKMNKSLLEQIAYRTGGKYYDINQADAIAGDLGKDIKFTPKEIIQTSEIELWNWKYLAAVIVLLLGIEWFLRKRNGML